MCACVSLTLKRTSAINTVTRVKSRVVISITTAEPTLVPKNVTVAIQPLPVTVTWSGTVSEAQSAKAH